jgi:hypothetical protein
MKRILIFILLVFAAGCSSTKNTGSGATTVVRVPTASGARRGEHAVMSLVVGGLAGAGIGAAAGSRSKGWVGASEGVGVVVGVAIGATGGAMAGAVIAAHATIYRAAPAAAAH